MKSTLMLAIGCGLFASVAFAQGQPAATGAPSAQDFVNKVAISDMFEIQSSQMALSKQADADTKPFAEKMIQDHQKTSTELKALVEGSMVKLTCQPRWIPSIRGCSMSSTQERKGLRHQL